MRTLYYAGAITLAALAAGCSSVQGVEPKPARPVKTQPVAAAPAAATIRYSASIEAFEQVTLSFKSSGYVDEILRRPGADGRSRVAQAGVRARTSLPSQRKRAFLSAQDPGDE